MRTLSHLIPIVAFAFAVRAAEDTPQPRKDAAAASSKESEARSARLEQMHQRAARIDVQLVQKDAESQAELIPDPILRYADQPRLFTDATLWLWTVDHRPIAVCKIEDYRPASDDSLWLTCFSSATPERVAAQWDDGQKFSSRAPGIRWQSVPSASAPGANATHRLRQMKGIARRFSAKMVREEDHQQMRLLTRHLYRYSDPANTLLDGAIFALTANGTNPDMLLLLQAETATDPEGIWRYGVVPVTADAVALKLDGKQVWHKERTAGLEDDRFCIQFRVNRDPK